MGANHSKLEAFFEETTAKQRPPTIYRFPKFVELWPMPRNPVSGADMSEVLTVFEVDPLPQYNASQHYTSKFAILQEGVLLVRRGQQFRINLMCNRKYDESTDVISFIFYLGGVKVPKMESYTMIFLPVAPAPKEKAPHEWAAQIVETGGGEGKEAAHPDKGAITTVEITTSPNSYFGEWYLQIDTNLLDDKKMALNYKMDKPIVLLFNPWNPKDTVYMPDEKLRQELVLKDEGILFCGVHKKKEPKPWTYDQYCPGVIECCNLMMKSGYISVRDRNDPVQISRLLAALSNAQDDNGLMEGRWDGNYKDGVNPNAWLSSAKIIQEYITTGKPVKYAQCWVYGGVITTLGRAMGIPTRTVTCYNSGHDSDATLTIDAFVNEMAETLKNMSDDTTWNYHVWNEMWMSRPDIEADTGEQMFSGWQAIDGTPQETSGATYRVGPASVTAVKMGEVSRPYDVAYVLGEVNADYVRWLYRGQEKPVKSLNWQTNFIGSSIITQKPGSYDREDIIGNYKISGNTKEQRNIMNWAWKHLGNIFPRFEKNKETSEMKISLEPAKEVLLGQNLRIRIRTNNKSKLDQLSVRVVLTLEGTTYTNKFLYQIKQKVFNQVVGKNADLITMEVPYNEYLLPGREQGYIRANMLATVPELKLDYFLKQSFRVRAPDVLITAHGDRAKGVPLQVTTMMKNTLPKFISKGFVVLHGSGVGEGQKHFFRDGAAPGEELSHTFTVQPKRSGDMQLNAKFWSPETNFSEGILTMTIN